MFTEKLTEFFNIKEHAETATYTQQGGGTPTPISIIYEAEYYAPLELVQSEGTTILAMLADIPLVKDGDTIVARGKTYVIRIPKKDFGGGTGLVLLILEDAS